MYAYYKVYNIVILFSRKDELLQVEKMILKFENSAYERRLYCEYETEYFSTTSCGAIRFFLSLKFFPSNRQAIWVAG